MDEGEWVTFNCKLRPWMASVLDEEAKDLGISRNALIRIVLADHIKKGS